MLISSDICTCSSKKWCNKCYVKHFQFCIWQLTCCKTSRLFSCFSLKVKRNLCVLNGAFKSLSKCNLPCTCENQKQWKMETSYSHRVGIVEKKSRQVTWCKCSECPHLSAEQKYSLQNRRYSWQSHLWINSLCDDVGTIGFRHSSLLFFLRWRYGFLNASFPNYPA